MKKRFLSWALALCALMVSIPAKAKVVNVSTYDELITAFTNGKDPASPNISLTNQDTIRLTADITFSLGIDANYTLNVYAGTTRTLDLNGYTLKHLVVNTAPFARIITMFNNTTLNICDSRGTGRMINDCHANFSLASNPEHFDCSSFGINSACVANSYDTRDDIATKNCVVNIYGGKLIAQNYGNQDAECSAIQGFPTIVPNVKSFDLLSSNLLYSGGGHVEAPNMTVNLYGGSANILYSKTFTIETYVESYDAILALKVSMNPSQWSYYEPQLERVYVKYTGNPMNINLYGGSIGTEMMAVPALTYPKGFSGTLKDGTIYGIASEDHLNNFNAVADGVKVYLNGTQTTVNALKTQDLNDKTVRFSYEPEISVSGVEVTKDNCTDIMPWEEFKASFDYATNTLYLKTLSNPTNVLNGIQFADFDLRIVVDGYWRINGSIVGTNGDLTITSNHFALTEEDGDALVMKPGDNTAITLSGHCLTLTNRVRLLCYNNESGHTPQSAVKCHDMWVNNSWFDAWGKKPIVDCTYGSVVNATIKTGSFKNSDVIQVEPNITKYVVWVDVNDKSAGTVTGDGLVNEGVSHTVTATPKSGYHFLRWSNGVTENPYTFVVTQDTVLTAIFEADVVINYYDINVVSEDETMGTVSGGGTHIEQGQTVTITATPNEGYQFLYWTTADGQVQGAISQWTATKDETLIAHFRVAPPADAYNLWVCGTQVTGSNSADILGDGVWCYDHATRTLSTMKMATYTIENHGFIEDWVTDAGSLTVVFNHLIDATCTTTDNVIRTAIVSTKGMTFTGSAYNGPSVTAKNMYVANFSDVFTITGHITAWLYLQNTTDFGRNYFTTAILLAGKTPSLVVNGANLEVLSGVGESTGYKVSNKTDQAANLSLINAVVDDGSISAKSLYISDNSPKYEINYLTPSIESLCAVGGFNNYFEGTYVTLRAYPATGYKFVSWSDGNTDNPRYMVMPAQNVYLDPIVEVDDSQTPKGAIINASATEGQGSIADFTSGWYAEGTELTITAVAAEGYTFVQWSDGEVANPYFITVEDKKNINITAMFEPTATAVNNVESQKSNVEVQKILRNGILFIERNGKIFNAQGTRVK
ncbi:MAG: InlB B-repeat-containing protein [Paludibacteraceae bacterium]|nr:InlB B-repeat-containing protein [Paludibacteraceae bacterium]